MDIGCFQVKRVLQDVEQTVRERGRLDETVRARRQRALEKKRAEATSRRADLRGQVGKRIQTIERSKKLHRSTRAAPFVESAPVSREQAGFQLLAQLLAEAGERGRALLINAARLSYEDAAQAEPLALADTLCARCEGLSELVLDLTDQLTAGIMGLRPAAAQGHGGPSAAQSPEHDVARGRTPNATLGTHTTLRSTTLAAHPFADAETLDFILDQLILTVCSAKSLAAPSHRVRPVTDDARAVPHSPLNMTDAVMMARIKAHLDDGRNEGHAEGTTADSSTQPWKRLNAERKMAMVSNETVAQIAPVLLKYGLMSFAAQLKKYGFHRLPALRKASVEQLEQLGMSSKQAAMLLRAVTGAATTAKETPSDGSRSVTKRPHGVDIPNEAWFYTAELEPEPERRPVLMADVQPVSRHVSPRVSRLHNKRNAAIGSLVSSANFDGIVERDGSNTGTGGETASKERYEPVLAEHKAQVERYELALRKEVREEQQANDWLRARPPRHRARILDLDKAKKDAAVNSTLWKGHRAAAELVSELSVDNPAVSMAAGMVFSESTGSLAGQVYAQQSATRQAAAELDDEIHQLMSMSAPRSVHVYVGDPRFLPSDASQAHDNRADYTGGEFIDRWSSLQLQSPESIESHKQALRLASAWQPRTKRSFRVERVLGA